MISIWNQHLPLLILLTVTALIYLTGVWKVWRRAGVGHGITLRRCFYFLMAILALAVALVSPLDTWSEAGFSAHMVQHLLIILVAAPLLVRCDFPLALLWALPRVWARDLGRFLYRSPILSPAWKTIRAPVSAWSLFTVTLWIWHTSALFNAALGDETVHAGEHFSFLLSAMLFWRVVIQPTSQNNRQASARYGLAIPYLFTTAVQSTILGALITFSSQPWYSDYLNRVTPWGLAPLQDQQLAGLIMWMPGGAVFTLLTIGYFAAWLHSLERQSVDNQNL